MVTLGLNELRMEGIFKKIAKSDELAEKSSCTYSAPLTRLLLAL
jgi:hypothetical protein